MAITPDEAAKLTEMNEAEVARLEERLDQYLRERYHPSSYRKVYFDINGASQRAREELIRRFEKAGWSVTSHSSQRDGDTIALEPIQRGEEPDVPV